MRIFNVRKGQFVYYQNQLHKVYSVKPFFKESVHLIRLKDFKQQLSTAKEIDLYKPKHLDSFTFNHVVYTLDKDKRAEAGDYILVVYPSPDYLDHHYLHAIEMVASIEPNGVISTKSNGIKHQEYWVMIPEVLDNATNIDVQDKNLISDEDDLLPQEEVWTESDTPYIGDIYEQVTDDFPMTTMVIALQNESIYLAGGLKVTKDELTDPNQWKFKYNVSES